MADFGRFLDRSFRHLFFGHDRARRNDSIISYDDPVNCRTDRVLRLEVDAQGLGGESMPTNFPPHATISAHRKAGR